MRKLIYTLFTFIFTIPLLGNDYLILRNSKQDTIWGYVTLGSGNVKVKNLEGKQKYKFNEVYEFETKDYNFITIPCKIGYDLAVREISGAIDLYFSDVNMGSLNSTNSSSFEAELFALVSQIIINNLDTYYIRKGKEEAVKVYTSSDKFLEYTAQVFKDDLEIYEEIVNEKYDFFSIEYILAKYNRKHEPAYSRNQNDSKQINENISVKLNPTKESEYRLQNSLKNLKMFTSIRFHPKFSSECDSCYNEIEATTIHDSMNIVLKSGLILDLNGDVPQAPKFLLIKALRKPGKDSADVIARLQYLEFLSIYEAIDGIPYSEIDHLNIYRTLLTPKGEKCINVLYRVKYNEFKKWKIYYTEVI